MKGHYANIDPRTPLPERCRNNHAHTPTPCTVCTNIAICRAVPLARTIGSLITLVRQERKATSQLTGQSHKSVSWAARSGTFFRSSVRPTRRPCDRATATRALLLDSLASDHSALCLCCTEETTANRLVGLVVKASTSGAEDPGFESRLRRGFSPG